MVEKTVGDIIKQGVSMLKETDNETPLLDAQLILGNILGVDKLYIMTNYNKVISQEIWDKFFEDIQKRVLGMPVQYIIGTQEFMSLNFKVNKNVLIPRPDTEILVEEILKDIDQAKPYTILDIGTGSGNIPITLAKYIKNAYLYSVDISEEATKIAKENAKLNSVEDKISFYNGDVFEPISDLNIKFDIIVSNPPYISGEDIKSLKSSVKDYEPYGALYGGVDGLDFYRKIILESAKYLKDCGIIYFEIGYNQSKDVEQLLQLSKFDDINIVKDLASRDRVVKAKKI